MKLSAKLSAAFGVMALLFVFNGTIGFLLLGKIDRTVMRFVDELLPNAQHADKMGDNLLRTQQLINTLSTQHDDSAAVEGEIAKLREEFASSAARLSAMFDQAGNQTGLRQMRGIEDGYRFFVEAGLAAARASGDRDAEQNHAAMLKVDSLRETLEGQIETLKETQTVLAQSAGTASDDLIDLMRWTMAATGGVILALCLLVMLLVRRGVVRPLAEIAAVAGRIADGELQLRLRRTETDEVGELSRAIDHLLDRIAGSLALNAAVLGAVPDPIFMTGEDDVILLANDAAAHLAGVPRRELLGRACTQAVKPGLCGTALRPARQCGQDIGLIEYPTPAGTLVLQPSAVPVLDDQGTALGYLEVARDVTGMARKERETAGHLERLEHVNAAVDQAAWRIAEATDSIACRMEQVAAGAVAQTERVGEAVVSIGQVSASVEEVAANAAKAARLAEDAREKARDGAAVVSDSVAAIGAVQELSEALKQSLASLGGQAEAIGRIMGVISDIADQTNLLALNAAIEAARAGEAGRGFAVVADEVRKLAEKTMAATKEVGQAVERIQSGVGTSISGMDEAACAVRHAAGLATLSGQALEGIVPLVEETSRQVERIALAAEEQSAANAAINDHIREVDAVSRETASGVEDSKQASAALAAMAHDLKELAQAGVPAAA
ncbi:methyl-accepting chemotaxis protein [Solidesulfovibrio sp.]|uniref:methyl-accepting chemotaxis protein n=1 Tax=Solidesulfovibrio sp. TaxID=2910990 RepID=UPI002633DE4F|nr:methyl-accepting chemotaxis protein [Solidesulfovibrio sp.]